MSGLILSLVVPAITGTLFTYLLLKDDEGSGLLERLFIGYSVGAGLLTYEMFILGVFRVRYGVFAITSAQLMTSALALFLLIRLGGKRSFFAEKKHPALFHETPGWGLVIFLAAFAWIALKAAFVLYEGISRPVAGWDAVVNWSAGAKAFFYGKGLLLDSADNFFGKGVRPFLGHPIHNPLMQVWTALCVGTFHEAYVKAWEAFYFISLIGVFYFAVKREAGRLYGIIGSLFLAGMPMLTYHGTEGYSDLPLSLYALSGAVCFWRYLSEDKKAYLALSGMLAGMAVFTKNEGLFFFFATGGALFLSLILRRRPFLKDMAVFILPFIAISGPWLIFKFVNGFGFGHMGHSSAMSWLSDPKSGSSSPKGIHWEIFGSAFRSVFIEADSGLFLPFWIAVSAFGIRTVLKTDIKYLFMVIIFVMGFFTFTYLTLEVTAVTEATAINRNIITFMPVVFFASLLLLSRLRSS